MNPLSLGALLTMLGLWYISRVLSNSFLALFQLSDGPMADGAVSFLKGDSIKSKAKAISVVYFYAIPPGGVRRTIFFAQQMFVVCLLNIIISEYYLILPHLYLIIPSKLIYTFYL